jgi:protein-disulfide isomerase
MPILRRSLLALVGTSALLPGLARADSPSPAMTERSVGKPGAPTVIEYFSLTCTHCAAFAREVLPQVISQLVDPGKVRIVFRDFPLDQVALTAAMVARALPPERYVPFIEALFASQDRWAFAQGVNSTAELRKMATLAGMSADTFNATIADTKLKTFILNEQDQAEKQYQVDSTPTFISGNKAYPGEQSFDQFARMAGVTAS